MVQSAQIHRLQATFRSHSSSIRHLSCRRLRRILDGINESSCASRWRLNYARSHESSFQEGRRTLRNGLGVVQHATCSWVWCSWFQRVPQILWPTCCWAFWCVLRLNAKRNCSSLSEHLWASTWHWSLERWSVWEAIARLDVGTGFRLHHCHSVQLFETRRSLLVRVAKPAVIVYARAASRNTQNQIVPCDVRQHGLDRLHSNLSNGSARSWTVSWENISRWTSIKSNHDCIVSSLHRNPRVPCKSGIIPSIDLTKWADADHIDNSPHQYVRQPEKVGKEKRINQKWIRTPGLVTQ